MKSPIPNKFTSGFTLIELLVVTGIIALISSVTIPSYINFSRSQEVQQATLNLKNFLRDTQNRAISSEKSTPCTLADTLLGFYSVLTSGDNSATVSTGGLCGGILFNTSSSVFSTNSNIKIQGFVNAGDVSCPAINLVSGNLTVFFHPLAGGTQFFDGDTSNLPLTNPLNYSKIGIKVTNSQGKNDYVFISSSGDINEKSTCP